MCLLNHILSHSQTIRESWANTTEFNYSFFRKMHGNRRKHYLEINFSQWRDFMLTPNISSNSNEIKPMSLNNVNSADANFSVKVVFLVGETSSNETQLRISQESYMFGDMIQESFIDSYNNLTLKTIMMLKWVTTNCGDRGKYNIYMVGIRIRF